MPLAGASPCYGGRTDPCLQPLFEVSPPGHTWLNCQIPGKRVCLVTIGAVEKDLTEHIFAYFKQEYGLEIKLGAVLPIPEDLIRTARLSPDYDEPQLDAQVLINHLYDLMRKAGISNQAMRGLTLVVLTPVDIYLSSTPTWAWAFGANSQTRVSGELSTLLGVISYHRMDNRVWGLSYENDQFASRVRKMVSKYIGLVHYEVPLSSDPRSVMYNNILSLGDLDRMGERLPIGAR